MGQIAGIIADLRAGRDCQSLGGLDYVKTAYCLNAGVSDYLVSIPGRARLQLGPSNLAAEPMTLLMFQSLGGLDYGWDFALLAYPGVFVPVSIPVRARLRLGQDVRGGADDAFKFQSLCGPDYGWDQEDEPAEAEAL